MHRVVIAGVSTRAAAESAARAGFDVTAIDAFADADQHPAVRAISIPRPFTAHAAAAAASGIECDAVAYLANFENHPDAVRALSVDRTLWGNSPEVLHKVRDPQGLTRALRDRGIAAPAVRCPSAASHSHEAHKRQHEVPVDTEWLVKPLASGGGHGVRPWREGERVPNGCYLQQRIDGVPGSIAFVAARGRAVLLGVCRQLIGEPAFGAAGYRYCGSILNIAVEPPLVRAVSAIAETVSDESDLVGVNGIDFVAHSGEPYAIEVNPRWTASMEVVERAYDLSMFGLHAAACADGELPRFNELRPRTMAGAFGKAIVFAREAVTIGDTCGWLADPDVRDVPHPGERIRIGHPVCTVFAEGANEEECRASLVRRADAVYAEVARWKSH